MDETPLYWDTPSQVAITLTQILHHYFSTTVHASVATPGNMHIINSSRTDDITRKKRKNKTKQTNWETNKNTTATCACFYSVLVLNAQLLSPYCSHPDSKVHGTNMGPTWILSAPDGPHVGPMNLAIKADRLIVLIITAPKQICR